MSTPSSPAATAARRAAEEVASLFYDSLDAALRPGRRDPELAQGIAAIILKHHAALPAHGDGTGGGAVLAALHKCYAATGEEAGDIDDFRALVDREAHTVEAVEAMRRELDETASLLADMTQERDKAIGELAAATARADALAADKRRLDWLEASGFSLAKDTGFSGACDVWACFDAYPAKPESTANPFPMFASPRAAIDAAMGEKPGQGRHGDKSA